MAHKFAGPINRRQKSEKSYRLVCHRLRDFPSLGDLGLHSYTSRNATLYPCSLSVNLMRYFWAVRHIFGDVRVPLIQERLRDGSKPDITNREITR